MKKIFEKITILIFIVALALPTIVSALPADAPGGSTLDQRVKQRIKEQAVNLTDKEKTRYASRCVSTQSTVRKIQNDLDPVVKNRQSTYKKVDAKLWIIIGQLKLANQDTFDLEAQRSQLAKLVTIYDSTLDQYSQTLDDIVSMNCQADTNGFIALVKTSRYYHDSLRKQSDDIKAYTVNTVLKTLTGFSNALQPKTSTENN